MGGKGYNMYVPLHVLKLETGVVVALCPSSHVEHASAGVAGERMIYRGQLP